MKHNLIRLSEQYAAALQKHLKPGPHSGRLPSLSLGRRAVAHRLETLDLARIHEQALVSLNLSAAKNATARRAGTFFSKVNSAIEATHAMARQTQVDLSHLRTTLSRRTRELAVLNRELQRGAIRRKAMEDNFTKRGKHHQKSLEESLALQNRLRQLAHQVLAAQEDERKEISRALREEIAQTLVGINVRLLCMKQEVRNNSKGFKQTLANTRQLVARSALSIRQAGRKMGGL